MHTQDTIPPSAHLPTVEALLEQLEQMKGRVGAKERLDFLLKKGPEVVPGFDFADAFDVTHREHTARLQKLEELRASLDAMTARWHGSSLEDDVKKAGDRLIGHLSEFVRQARAKELEVETDTLACLWEGAPDVFPAFGLPTPSYYPKRAIEETAPPRNTETRERDDVQLLEEAKERLEEEALQESDFKGLEELKEELQKSEVRAPLHIGTKPFGTAEGSQRQEGRRYPVETEEEPLGSSSQEVLEPEMDLLDIKSWTSAINAVHGLTWRFDRQLRGRVGDRARRGLVLIWKMGLAEIRLDIERLSDDDVLVRMTPPRSTRHWDIEEENAAYQVHAVEMKASALVDLHKDPVEFVKSVLRKT